MTPTAATDSAAATHIGSTDRTSTSASSSTELPTLATSSPPAIRRTDSACAATRRRYSPTRALPAARSATSWMANRSQ